MMNRISWSQIHTFIRKFAATLLHGWRMARPYLEQALRLLRRSCRKSASWLRNLWLKSAPLRAEALRVSVRVAHKLRPETRRGVFTYVFFLVVAVLAVVRWVHPEFTFNRFGSSPVVQTQPINPHDTVAVHAAYVDSLMFAPRPHVAFADSMGRPVRHRIYSVPHFGRTFPDLNDVQLATAERLGVSPVRNREQAARRKDELVYMGANPYFVTKQMSHSIPYLVPRAARLLEHLSRTFFDSLQVKGLPWNKMIVTSMLRTEDDVARLRRHNVNASDQSCHRYGTTFDVSYSKYQPIADPQRSVGARAVRDDTLKWVLSEVLRDARLQGLCYVKYEVHQGCFHITAR